MKHEVVRTIAAWNRLRDEWNELLANSRANSIFMTWQWLDTWLSLYSDPPPALLVVCVRDSAGKLVGLAPYYETRYRLVGLVPYRVLRVIGDINSGAEYQTCIARQDVEAEVLAAVAGALRGLRAEWDLIWMPKLSTWSGTHDPLVAALRAGGLAVNCRRSVFSTVALPDSLDAYLQKMSANRRQQVRRMTKRILAKPGVEIRKVRTAEELEPALAALFDLHGKRWRAAGEAGVFARNPMERAFYERFVPLALERGWLALYVLLDAGVPKAAQIGYVYHGVLLQLQEGFDPDYSPHVGNALRTTVIEECIAGGIREYDFLGGASEHKRRWLAEERFGIDLLAAAPRWKNFPIVRAGVWPTGSYLQPRAPRLPR